jgi:triosephosphate isomerase
MILIANWKAYVEDSKKARALLSLSKRLARGSDTTFIIAPPAPFLAALSLKAGRIAFAAQDISITTGGAATGESTAQAFANAGATYAIVGHSERRAMGDTNEVVSQKLAHALAHELRPVLCVGERERDSEGRYLTFIREQIESALRPLSQKERKQLIIAYEPIWAIGKSADAAIRPADLSEMVLYIRKVLSDLLPGRSGLTLPILYGGSVEPENIRILLVGTGIDGFLIGHASVDPVMLQKLVKALL